MFLLEAIKDYWSLCENSDKRNFLALIALLMLSGVLSLIGISIIIPFVTFLMNDEGANIFQKWFPNSSHIFFMMLLTLGLILAFWIKNIACYVSLLFQSKVLFSFTYKISGKLFHKYMSASYFWHINKNSAKLIRNINNETRLLADFVILPLGTVFSEFISLLFIGAVLLYINFYATVVILISLFLVAYYFMKIARKKAEHYSQIRATAWSSMVKEVVQGLSGIKEAKLYKKEDYFLTRFSEFSKKATDSSRFSFVFSNSSRFFLEPSILTVILITVLVQMSLGVSAEKVMIFMSVFGVSTMQLLPGTNRLVSALAQIKYGLPAIQLIKEELHSAGHNLIVENNNKSKSLELKKSISLKKVNFYYKDSQKLIIDEINIEIKHGESIAFVGRSGSGKTTLVNIIMGMLEPVKGEVLVDKKVISSRYGTLLSWQKNIGYIPQLVYIYDGSILENVAFGVPKENIDEDLVWKALGVASLKDFVLTLPDSLETEVGENGILLSGGQRQRIGIARAMYRQPKVLVMDEATAALDNSTEREITQAIKKASLNRTVITIAHRLSTIKDYDKIFLMDAGRIVACGKYTELLNNLLFNEMANDKKEIRDVS